MKNSLLHNLPHSYPFRFLDRILELNEKKGIAIKNVTVGEELFMGHFQENPILPGVILIEIMAQLSGLVINYNAKENNYAYLARVKDIKFRKPVIPGDQVKVIAEMKENFSKLACFAVSAFVDDVSVAEGELVMAC